MLKPNGSLALGAKGGFATACPHQPRTKLGLRVVLARAGAAGVSICTAVAAGKVAALSV